MNSTVLITGANRGIGLGLAQRYNNTHHVLFTCRSANAVDAVKAQLPNPDQSTGLVLDVADEQSIQRAVEDIQQHSVTIDLLINNAGIIQQEASSVLEVSDHDMLAHFNVNTLGALRMIQYVHPLMRDGGAIYNITSRMGQLSSMGSNHCAYRVSKSALNALTLILADALAHRTIRVNAICPGWVQTDMGGPHAHLTIAESCSQIMATIANEEWNGQFLHNNEVIPW